MLETPTVPVMCKFCLLFNVSFKESVPLASLLPKLSSQWLCAEVQFYNSQIRPGVVGWGLGWVGDEGRKGGR